MKLGPMTPAVEVALYLSVSDARRYIRKGEDALLAVKMAADQHGITDLDLVNKYVQQALRQRQIASAYLTRLDGLEMILKQ